jgi:hypothetical protein
MNSMIVTGAFTGPAAGESPIGMVNRCSSAAAENTTKEHIIMLKNSLFMGGPPFGLSNQQVHAKDYMASNMYLPGNHLIYPDYTRPGQAGTKLFYHEGNEDCEDFFA